MQIIFFALLAGQLLVAVVFNFLVRTTFADHEFTTKAGNNLSFGSENTGLPHSIVVYGVPLLALGMIGLSSLLYRKMAEMARLQPALQEKLLRYRATLIVQWALSEAATLIVLVGYLLSGSLILLLFAAGCMLLFLRNRPDKQRLITTLELSAQEQGLLDDPDVIVLTYRKTRN